MPGMKGLTSAIVVVLAVLIAWSGEHRIATGEGTSKYSTKLYFSTRYAKWKNKNGPKKRFGLFKIQAVMNDLENMSKAEQTKFVERILSRTKEREESMLAIATMPPSKKKTRMVKRMRRRIERREYFLKLSQMTENDRNQELMKLREVLLAKCESRKVRLKGRIAEIDVEITDNKKRYKAEENRLKKIVLDGEMTEKEKTDVLDSMKEGIKMTKDRLDMLKGKLNRRKKRLGKRCAELKSQPVE